MQTEIALWDVVVIGGGPAGMIAAGRAAERGLSVLLLEKNAIPGKKLLITGGGRCNLTNSKSPLRALLASYKEDADFLFSPFSQFGVRDTLNFFNSRGMPTKEEAEGRIFPASDKARSVWEVLRDYMDEKKVTLKTNVVVRSVEKDPKTKHFVITPAKGKVHHARSCMIATGGTSRPETGSTGDGFKWLSKLGHRIQKDTLALVPIVLEDSWVRDLAGVSLENIKLTAFSDGKKQAVERGKMLFTHVGISGPAALHISKVIGEILPWGKTRIELDLFPTRDSGAIRRSLQELLVSESNKKIKNVLSALIPSALVDPLLKLSDIDGNTVNHSVRHDSRTRLSLLVKSIPLYPKGLMGSDKAIVSSGGVPLKEINMKTMESRLVPNLYVLGDVLDVDRPSGGYSLQLCWTTGYVAGNHCK